MQVVVEVVLIETLVLLLELEDLVVVVMAVLIVPLV